jgi:hypothetical protein
MASAKMPPPDLAALAAEALDLWQEHLALSANDPAAKAEMMRLLEPSRQAFADWALMLQNAPHATGATSKSASAAAGTAAARAASDDGALRIAQLAHRLAELEKRVAKLEPRGADKAAKTPAARGKPKH